MYDVLLYENGDGGEVKIVNGDLATTDSLANQPYLAHFGGNVEASTTGDEVVGDERNDWWGNFLFENEEDAQMNSQLERSLNDNSLNAAGRSEIERRAKEDLEYLSVLSEVETNVFLTGVNRIRIEDNIKEIQSVYKYIWDATKSELIQEIIL